MLGFTFIATAQPSADAGKTIFRNQCASCHNKNMVQALTGPALGGVQERWAEYPESDLYAWIRNSIALVEAGHPQAVKVYKEYNNVPMQAFPNLTDDDIASLLLYIDGVLYRNLRSATRCYRSCRWRSTYRDPAGSLLVMASTI